MLNLLAMASPLVFCLLTVVTWVSGGSILDGIYVGFWGTLGAAIGAGVVYLGHEIPVLRLG